MLTLQGVIPPVPTPFTKQGDLDTDTLKQLLTRLEPQVDGFLILGSTGEAALLTETERHTGFRGGSRGCPHDQTAAGRDRRRGDAAGSGA